MVDVMNNNNSGSLLSPMELSHTGSELQNALVNDMSWLLKESNDYNMIVNVGEAPNIRTFRVHTSVLRARSLYFRAILSSDHHFGRNSLIQITQANIEPDIFDVILKYLYTGRIYLKEEKTVEKIFEYVLAAEKLWLLPLIQYIENYLIQQMSDRLKSNFVYVLTMIKSNPASFKLLSEFADDILKNNPCLLFQSNDFYKLPEPILVDLLQNRNFSKEVTEKKILSDILNWGIKQHNDLVDKDVSDWNSSDFNKLQTSLQHCISLIRFINIPPEVFYEVTGPYKRIFTPGFYERIMQLPIYVAYNKLRNSTSRPSSPKLKVQPTFPSTPLLASILQGFPKPPTKLPKGHKQTMSPPMSPPTSPPISRSVSPVNHSTSKSRKSRQVIANSSEPKQYQSIISSAIVKSKHSVKRKTRSLSFDKPKLLPSKRAETLPVLLKPPQQDSRPSSTCSIESSTSNSSPIKSILKKSNITPPDSIILEPLAEGTELNILGPSLNPLVINNKRKSSNRKISIITSSRPTTPISNLSSPI